MLIVARLKVFMLAYFNKISVLIHRVNMFELKDNNIRKS